MLPIQPSRTLLKQDWMNDPALLRIFEIINPVLCVGGAVRNALLGREVEDIDLATPLLPEEVTKRLEKAGVRVVPTGIDHGTLTAIIDGKPFEITTLRRDVETDGRRAVVAFTDDWAQDANRRDFTINTLLMDLDGQVFDPLGCGLADLDSGIVRFVGDPAARIAEDHLRILRFFRFHGLYGTGDFDSAGLDACAAAANKIQQLSRERVSQEFFKILAGDKPFKIFDIMFRHGVLKEFEFETYNPELLEHFVNFQSRYSLIAVPLRALILAGLDMKNIKAMEKQLLFPKVFIKDMEAILGALSLRDLSCDSAVRESVYRFGKGITAQALMLELAQDRVMNSYAPFALKLIQSWDVPDLPFDGRDLMATGIKQGAELGKTLSRIEDWWISQDFKPDKIACLNQV